MRAPPASNRPMIGARAFIAMSWILTIFCAWASECVPPKTVKSLATGNTVASVDRPPAGDHAVTGDPALLHAEISRAMLDEHVELPERALVHQQFEPLARRQLAALVLSVDACLTTAGACACAALFELFEDVLHTRLTPRSGAKSIACTGI